MFDVATYIVIVENVNNAIATKIGSFTYVFIVRVPYMFNAKFGIRAEAIWPVEGIFLYFA
ncbi:MAG: hypothetical protein OXM58_21010 [Rhodospirillaceae bacterium]|nr:hypothetical protein [Rhodospirillaceae bacterium]